MGSKIFGILLLLGRRSIGLNTRVCIVFGVHVKACLDAENPLFTSLLALLAMFGVSM